MLKKAAIGVSAGLLLLASCTTVNTTAKENRTILSQQPAKNIVLMIIDGMGFEHVKAARIYNGLQPFSFEKFPCTTKVATCSFAGADDEGHCLEDSDDVTDSAAAATAIATGRKVMNGAISRDLPKSSEDIETILELARRHNKSTGIVATKLFTDATPAAFVSHADDRDLTDEILRDMFAGSQPNVIFGADTDLHRHAAKQSSVPYQMVHTSGELHSLANQIAQGESCTGALCPHIYGGFGQHELIPGVYNEKSGLPLEITPVAKYDELQIPHLSQMADAALKILSKNERGFFLMIESSMPDIISHYNQQIDKNPRSPKAIEILIREMLEVDSTVKVIEAFVANHPDTLVIVTADHETGGLVIEADKTACLGKTSCVPTVRWTSEKYEPTEESAARHTAADVPLYSLGQGSERFCAERINNTDIANLALAK